MREGGREGGRLWRETGCPSIGSLMPLRALLFLLVRSCAHPLCLRMFACLSALMLAWIYLYLCLSASLCVFMSLYDPLAVSLCGLGWRRLQRLGWSRVGLGRSDRPHPKSVHGGAPVQSGEKWAVNLWVRQRGGR